MGESKARDPLVREPRRWYAFGALPVTPLGMERAARNAAECDKSVFPAR